MRTKGTPDLRRPFFHARIRSEARPEEWADREVARETAHEVVRLLRPGDTNCAITRAVWVHPWPPAWRRSGQRAEGVDSAPTEQLAEGVGFEPTMGYEPIAVFKTAALGHYASPPVSAEVYPRATHPSESSRRRP